MRIPFSCDIPILKPAFAFVLLAIVVCPLTTQNSPATQSSGHVTLTYMGTAAWEISDGNTVILLDPYLSRILLPLPGAGSAASGRAAGDTHTEHRWNEVVPPDVATIDAHIRRADFVLVTHTHIDHVIGCSSHRAEDSCHGDRNREHSERHACLQRARKSTHYRAWRRRLRVREVLPQSDSQHSHGARPQALFQFGDCPSGHESAADVGANES